MSTNILEGKLVRLLPFDSKNDAQSFSDWQLDSEYMRLSDTGPVRVFTADAVRKFIEEEQADCISFAIRTCENNELIGSVELDGVHWANGDCFVGLGIGNREYWGKGYGSEALDLMLGYGFLALNLHRVSLNVFEYNTRAIRAYEKLGFVHEGRARSFMERNGKRWDILYMGILAREWRARHHLE